MPQAAAALPFCYLTTTGRRTGTLHRIEIWFALHDGVLYLLAGGGERSDWVRNLMSTPDVVIELGDERRLTTARVLEPGTDQDALARRLLLEKYGRDGEDLDDWGRTALPVGVAWPEA